MNKYIVVSDSTHPLFDRIKNIAERDDSPFFFFNIDEDTELPSKGYNLADVKAVFDLTLLNVAKKQKLLKNLSSIYKLPFFTDTTTLWSAEVLKGNDFIQGVFASAFLLPTMKFEAFIKADKHKEYVEDFFNYFSMSPFYLKSAPLGFHTPRTIAMIINEAFFALEEELASKEAIDSAMKFGVNYPHGPFEWLHLLGGNKGAKMVTTLLDTIFEKTHDERYRVCLSLRELSL